MTTYNKSLSADFGGNLNQRQFHEEIESEAGITVTLQGITKTGDDIEIIFDSALSAGEQTTLNTLISNHSPSTQAGSQISNISIPEHLVESNSYMTITSFNYPGTNFWKNTTNIKVISFMEEGGTDYDVKIYDITNHKKIAEKTFSNTDEDICDLGTLNNLPSNEAIFEVCSRTSGDTIAHVKNVNIYYG